MLNAITMFPHIQYKSRVPSINLRASRATLKSQQASDYKVTSLLPLDLCLSPTFVLFISQLTNNTKVGDKH